MKVRIKFSKHGVLKYIGHLDLMRYFQKAFRRTDIEVLYSKGFSPHMIMSFAQPLGVGVESDGEYFDLEVADTENVDLFPEKLNATMAEGIVILGAYILPEKSVNAMASVKAADYEVDFYERNPLSAELLEKYKKAKEVSFIKTTKTGEHSINVKDFVFDISLLSEHVLFAKVDCSSGGNLKPKNLCEALLGLEDKRIEDFPFHIVRKETYKLNENDKLVPLSEVN